MFSYFCVIFFFIFLIFVFVIFFFFFFFFFQAEDGIRDIGVTGVQTCALPIYFGVYFRACQGGLTELPSFRQLVRWWRAALCDALPDSFPSALAVHGSRRDRKSVV